MKYFTIEELVRSKTANQYGIDNTPTLEVKNNLEILINKCLDYIRELYKKPIYVNSGYRCAELNYKVRGKSNSHHLKGMAADITTGNIEENKVLFNLIKDSCIPFTQLIDESNYNWIHISYDEHNLKRQILHL